MAVAAGECFPTVTVVAAAAAADDAGTGVLLYWGLLGPEPPQLLDHHPQHCPHLVELQLWSTGMAAGPNSMLGMSLSCSITDWLVVFVAAAAAVENCDGP